MAKTASFRDFPKPVLKKTRKGVPRALLAYVNANGKRWSKEFPLATRASVIIAWQEELERREVTADVVAMPGTFAGDVERYLDRPDVMEMTSFKSRKSDINAHGCRSSAGRPGTKSRPRHQQGHGSSGERGGCREHSAASPHRAQ